MIFTFIGPFFWVTSILDHYISRKFEYEADEFACQHGMADDLRKGLVNIYIQNAANLNPDSFYSMLNNSHPTLMERVSAIESYYLRSVGKSME